MWSPNELKFINENKKLIDEKETKGLRLKLFGMSDQDLSNREKRRLFLAFSYVFELPIFIKVYYDKLVLASDWGDMNIRIVAVSYSEINLPEDEVKKRIREAAYNKCGLEGDLLDKIFEKVEVIS